MNKTKSKSKKSDKGSASKDESKTSESKASSAGGGGGGGESPAVHHSTSSVSSASVAQQPTAAGPNTSTSNTSNTSSTSGPAGSTPATGGAGGVGGGGGGASTMNKHTTPGTWFTSEIQQMMHGFGDCRKPLAESAALIEEIVHQQMVTLLFQASEVASMRNARFMSIEDFLFLLRKDEVKLRRLIRYLTFKDKAASLKIGAGMEDDETAELAEGKQPTIRKKKKICYDFLNSIDQTGELVALFEDDGYDEVKQERAMRADLQTRQMDMQQYMEYCEARHTSFTAQKFKDWLMTGITLDLKPNPLAMKVLSYLAYETVAQIVDLSLLVKRDVGASVEDPFTTAMPSVCLSYDSVTGLGTGGKTITSTPAITSTSSSKSPSRAGSPTATTPPTTPTAPSPMSSTPGGSAGSTPATPATAGGVQAGSTSGSSNSSKAKAKKRKKSESQSSKEMYFQPIHPRDIREALRRYSQAIGPFADFSKSPMLSPKSKILCC